MDEKFNENVEISNFEGKKPRNISGSCLLLVVWLEMARVRISITRRFNFIYNAVGIHPLMNM